MVGICPGHDTRHGESIVTPEEIFTALAAPEGFPRTAMIAAGERREEMIPVFLDLIHRLRRAGPDTVAEDDLSVFLFAYFLLGEWRDAAAYRPLAGLLRRDTDFLEVVLGDALTEGTSRVIAGVFDGDLAPILEVIEDPAADVFVRSQMIDALVMIARSHPDKAPDIKAYMETFHSTDMEKPEELWDTWAFAVAELGLAHLEPMVVQAYEDEWISPDLSTVDDFRNTLREAIENGTSSWFHRSRNTRPIESAVDELSGWYCFSDKYQQDRKQRGYRDDWLYDFASEPFQREMPKVGRNDPCPCGSGKKFKKCCLH
nr:DUF1186 domain-containing protein [Ruegeria alba]